MDPTNYSYSHSRPYAKDECREAVHDDHAQPVSPVAALVRGIHKEQDSVAIALDELTARLDAVLAEVAPAPECKDGPGERHPSPLCNALSSRMRTEMAIHDRIRSLIERLTV